MKKIILAIGIFLYTVSFSFGKNINLFKLDTVPQVITDTAFLRVLGKARKGDSSSMYIIGKCYLLGSHVKRDVEKAFEWNTKSAEGGFTPAWLERGFYYKYGTGRAIDYTAAYESFSEVANRNNPSGIYYKGYMLFKGLGCTQNYTAAVQEFKRGARLENPASMYFLGLCFRNGFGIVANIDSARHWLLKSAELNYDLAEDELMAETPEYCPNCPKIVQNLSEAINLGDRASFDVSHYTQFDNKASVDELKGNFLGYIVKYDYGGTKIIESNALFVQFEPQDTLVKMKWYEEDITKMIPLTAKLRNNHFIFDRYSYRRPEHYHMLTPFINTFQSIDFLEPRYDNGDTILIANLTLFVNSLLEPQQKIMLVLRKESSTIDNGKAAAIKDAINIFDTADLAKKALEAKNEVYLDMDESKKKIASLTAYPNPFDGLINIEFSLRQAGEARIKLIATDGKVYYTTPLRSFLAGENMTSIEPNVPSGAYLITLEAGNETKNFKMIKQ